MRFWKKIWLYAGTSEYRTVLDMKIFSDNQFRADNQQGRLTQVRTLRDYTPNTLFI